MRLPNIPHRHVGDHVYTSRLTRRGLLVVAALVLAVVVGVLFTSFAYGAPRPVPTVPPHSTGHVRCTVLEHYRAGDLLGCTDGDVRFVPRGRRG